MKRILALILAAIMLTALAACRNDDVVIEDDFVADEAPEIATPVDDDVPDSEAENEASDVPSSETPDSTPEVKPEKMPTADKKPAKKPAADKKPAETPEVKPEVKPEEKPAEPAEKPAETPEATPEVKPEEKPAETPAGSTTGDIMLSIFRANKSKSIEDIANACLADKSIQFFSMTAPMEEGFFPEFDGDVKGFSKCIKFGPAMGSIAFSGLIFEVSGDAEAFAKDLKSRANPRWNICVEADQTVCEVSGNRVFFLMCPKTLGE